MVVSSWLVLLDFFLLLPSSLLYLCALFIFVFGTVLCPQYKCIITCLWKVFDYNAEDKDRKWWRIGCLAAVLAILPLAFTFFVKAFCVASIPLFVLTVYLSCILVILYNFRFLRCREVDTVFNAYCANREHFVNQSKEKETDNGSAN